MTSSGTIRAGIGGWTFDLWEGSFYPAGLPKKQQLAYAAEKLTTIEINGTYYRGQTPATFAKWASEVPDGFVFSVKGSRFVTNRSALSEAGESLQKFWSTGVHELGPRLGPIVWQFAPTKKFDPQDFEGFLQLLPASSGGIPLRHVLEVRHASFAVPEFVALARKYRAAICYAHHQSYPEIADLTADFVYARLQQGVDDCPTAYEPGELEGWCKRARVWAEGGAPADLPLAAPDQRAPSLPRDVFVYFIHEGKLRAPHGAMAFMETLGKC